MDLDQSIKELNGLRTKTEFRLIIFYLISVIFGIFLMGQLLPIISMGDDAGQIIFIPIVLVIAIIGAGHNIIIKKYRTVFKNTIVPIAVKQFGDGITYTQAGIPREVAKTTDMFGHFTKYSSEDTVSGKISDVEFKCSDVKLGYYTGGKHKRYVPVCHGQYYLFDFNKRFKTKTVIREKNASKPSGLSRIKLESEQFNSQFYIYTNNEHDAFYILTPHFMEKLLKLERKHPGTLFMAFYNSELHIGIHNDKDRFEPPLFSKIKKDIISSQLEDLNLINEIIEELKLNVRIFF